MAQSHITAVRWHERDEGLQHVSVVSAHQVLTVGVFQDPHFYPQVLANTIQWVSGQNEPEEDGGKKRKQKNDMRNLSSFQNKMTHQAAVNF